MRGIKIGACDHDNAYAAARLNIIYFATLFIQQKRRYIDRNDRLYFASTLLDCFFLNQAQNR